MRKKRFAALILAIMTAVSSPAAYCVATEVGGDSAAENNSDAGQTESNAPLSQKEKEITLGGNGFVN